MMRAEAENTAETISPIKITAGIHKLAAASICPAIVIMKEIMRPNNKYFGSDNKNPTQEEPVRPMDLRAQAMRALRTFFSNLSIDDFSLYFNGNGR